MPMISVKLYGRYYNVECDEKMTPKQALNRAVSLKRLGKSYSGPVQAKENLPKVEQKPVEKEVSKKKKAEK